MESHKNVPIPDLTDQIAIVTGASRGIGRAIAKALACCEAHVILAARDTSRLESVRAEIVETGATGTVVPVDLVDAASVENLFARVDAIASGRLDILINNAGIGTFGEVTEFPVEAFDRMVEVNLRGTFLACQEGLRRMKAAGDGFIINIASVVGLKGYPQQAGYTATKHGIVGLTKSLTIEAQEHGVRVSAICPGGVDTDLIAAARPDLNRATLMQPDDIAQTVLYLLGLPKRAAVDCIYIRRSESPPW